ncbi:hypothetical protein THF1C08_160084 [Vibrio jasicida]|uniref:Uncharacterized protein n=1 Tax=Vibrio jasicida TaxID=766224 RepID=A0AAU9QGY5_9VIBR|nr:hypothetical protein THF1C08_160084 [Vibrio jasicida]CAH1576945.1 hypothetical protein THF1A12_140084 [Vibrio jasicida]CAH1608553.1 hypothetical protein THF5G08_60273 [Vibrio jasicida]
MKMNEFSKIVLLILIFLIKTVYYSAITYTKLMAFSLKANDFTP